MLSFKQLSTVGWSSSAVNGLIGSDGIKKDLGSFTEDQLRQRGGVRVNVCVCACVCVCVGVCVCVYMGVCV